MASKKIVCLGGGSLYFRRALSDLVLSKELTGSEIVLYDIDAEKVQRMAELGRRLADEAGMEFKIRSTVRLADAVEGADFAISSIGGSGAEITRNVYDSYYHNADVRIPAKYGISQIIGDTCGPAGMMMGLRSIPVYIRICREMEKRCPNAILFSHSNPMAVLCRAMHKYSNIKVIGICHGVQGGIKSAAKMLGVPITELEYVWVGTNHYYWFTRVFHKGKDVYPRLKRKVAEQEASGIQSLANKLSLAYGHKIVYASDDHIIEFYPFLTQVQGKIKGLPYGMYESAKKHGNDPNKPPMKKHRPTSKLRAEFMRKYQQLLNEAQLPKERLENPLLGEGIGSLISAISIGRRQVAIVNLANQGAIPNLSPFGEVELEAVTDSQGVRPIQMGDAPPVLRGIMEKRFVWQDLVADAAVKGDRKLALQALLIDEMAIWPEKAEAMLEELLLASKDLLPQFFKQRKAVQRSQRR